MSRPKKNKNPFGPSQDAKKLHRCDLILSALQLLKNSHLRFDKVTHLAKYLSKHISQLDGKPLVSTTLLRNSDYRPLLQDAFDSELKTGTRGKPPISKSSEVAAPVTVRQLQIENSNLKHENVRLKARLADLGATGSVAPNTPAISPEAMRPFEQDFISTCQAMESVMKALVGFIKVDEHGSLVDPAKRVNKVIAEARLVAPFLRWKRMQGGA